MNSAQAWLLFALVTAAVWMYEHVNRREADSAHWMLTHHATRLSRFPLPRRRVYASILLLIPATGVGAATAGLPYMLLSD